MTFAELALPEPLLRAISARGYTTPTPVQEAVLDPSLRDRDLLVSSRTGSGKTLAFGLVLARDLADAEKSPSALVVAPTRELALQVARELTWLLAGARIATCVGGTDVVRELRALKLGAHVVVGTPGRLVDHLERKSLKLTGLRTLVLDEADEMLDMGFREELERILQDAPKERRTLLFSATIPDGIQSLARSYQRDAARVVATPPRASHSDIETRVHLIAAREREHAVVNTLRASDAESAIVFCSTRDHVNHLHANLVERGFAAVALSGELTQAERNRALAALRDGRARVLVATDVAARGLDLPDVGLVVQADLPQNADVLQHRSGRTGRAGRKGVSVLLVPAGSQRTAERFLREAHVEVTWGPVPTAQKIRARDEARLSAELIAQAAEPAAPEDLAAARKLLEQAPPEQLAALLIRSRRSGLPAPEELPLSGQLDASPSRGKSVRTGPAGRATATRASGSSSRSTSPASDGTPAPRSRRGPPATAGAGPMALFRVDVGRERNADPRWLLPLLCRRGQVAKEQIGKIRIQNDSTVFEVRLDTADAFDRAASKPDKKDPGIHISRIRRS